MSILAFQTKTSEFWGHLHNEKRPSTGILFGKERFNKNPFMLNDTCDNNFLKRNADFDSEIYDYRSSSKMDTSASQNQDSSLSSSDTGSPNPTSSIPTCVVAPTANDLKGDSNQLSDSSNPYIPSRKQREFIPENRKDDHYWEKRRKNNEAARRSREKRRFHDVVLENRIVDLTRDNCQLRNELFAIKKHFGIPLNEPFDTDEDRASHPKKPVTRDKSLSPPVQRNSPNPGMSNYLAAARASVTQAHGSHPPSMVPMHSSIPMPISLPGNYNSKGPMSYYIAVPSSIPPENYHGGPAPATSLNSSVPEQYATHTPTPSHSFKQEFSEDTLSSSNRRKLYNSGESIDTQVRKSNCDSSQPTSVTSHYSSSYSKQNIQSQAIVNTNSSELTHSAATGYLSDDHTQDEPLSLTVRKRVDSFSGNDSSVSYSSPESPVSHSPPSMALPLKLRHKAPMDFGTAFQNTPLGSSMVNGLTQLSEIALAQSGPLPLIKKSKSDQGNESENPRTGRLNQRSLIDPKYAERRRRNNEAARKCRENRKSLTKIREAKSDYLETENSNLRKELDTLQEEMKQLRDLIDRKKMQKTDSQDDIKTENP